ncbi:transcription factor Opi1-domain-containing protein [Triangularia verruculosa]|uniref:Transcription factor Opi1-domain-containing protein n=1 Tax=Triangularia verruculosa TaxID=2587418 RepID=A0AAN6XA43_9PEZI|nr:transcription factor Opi1-domain-containing protein [Triangularia verruculosa]
MDHMLVLPPPPPSQSPTPSQLKSQQAGAVPSYPDYEHRSTSTSTALHEPTSMMQAAASHPSHLTNLPLPPISHPHDPASPSFPDHVAELPPIQPPHEKPAAGTAPTLPSLSSVTGAQTPRLPSMSAAPEPGYSPLSTANTVTTTTPVTTKPVASPSLPTNHWPSLNPFTTYYTPSHVQGPETSMSADALGNKSGHHRATSVSLDDPGVRAAAEALGRLRTVDTMPHDNEGRRNRTPEAYQVGTPNSQESSSDRQQEPLLSLITTSYPSIAPVASYLESATSVCNTAYTNSKNYSPVLRRNAEYIEDRVVKPVAKTVGRYGSHGLRWWLQKPGRKQRSPSDLEDGRQGVKRRKGDVDRESAIAARVMADFDIGSKERRTSVSTVDTLPAYDDQRSPAYTETADDQRGSGSQNEGSGGYKLWVTTSSLRVAMQDESKKRLRALIRTLSSTNGQITVFFESLTKAVEEYDRSMAATHEDVPMGGQDDHTRNELSTRIMTLVDGITKTSAATVNMVNKCAASALPDNVKGFVARRLMSLPAQWKLMASQEGPDAPREGGDEAAAIRHRAHSALALAKVSLQIMTQITEVLDMTLNAAEEWCENQNRNDGSRPSSPMVGQGPVVVDGDVKMSE